MGWGWGFRAASQEAEGPSKTMLMSIGRAEVMGMKRDLEDSKIHLENDWTSKLGKRIGNTGPCVSLSKAAQAKRRLQGWKGIQNQILCCNLSQEDSY